MKILYFNQTGEIGGAETSLLDNLEFLRERGHQLAVAAPENGPLLGRAVVRGADTYPVECEPIRVSAGAGSLPEYIRATMRNARAFSGVCNAAKPDVVHGNTLRAGLIASIAAGSRIPVIWHIRYRMPDGLVSFMVRQTASFSAAAIIANSQFTAGSFSTTERMKSKTTVIYNGFDFDKFRGRKGNVRVDIGAGEDDIVVAQVGNIGDIKNQKLTLEAAAVALQTNPSLRFVFAGSPLFKDENERYEEELKELHASLGLGDRAVFLGYCDDVCEIYSAADIVVCPSRMETFGRVAVEAAAAGIPVIGACVGGLPEIIDDGRTGVLVRDVTAGKTAAEILRLAGDPDMRGQLGTAAQKHVTDKFSIRQLVTGLEKVYRQLIKQQ